MAAPPWTQLGCPASCPPPKIKIRQNQSWSLFVIYQQNPNVKLLGKFLIKEMLLLCLLEGRSAFGPDETPTPGHVYLGKAVSCRVCFRGPGTGEAASGPGDLDPCSSASSLC